MNNPFTTTQVIEYCHSIEKDLGSWNWCLTNMHPSEDGTKLLKHGSDGYIPLFFDLSDEQIEVIHDHYDIDPDLVNRLTLQLILTSMLGQMRNNSITDEG